jgi:hypothetical protein
MHMSTACAVTAPVPEPPGHRLNGKDTDDLHNIHEDLEDSLMLEGRDMQAPSENYTCMHMTLNIKRHINFLIRHIIY